jgi:hypothetical protein
MGSDPWCVRLAVVKAVAKCHALIYTGSGNGGNDQDITDLVGNSSDSTALINGCLNEAVLSGGALRFHGFTWDLEASSSYSIPSGSGGESALYTFLNKWANAMHSNGLTLTMSLVGFNEIGVNGNLYHLSNLASTSVDYFLDENYTSNLTTFENRVQHVIASIPKARYVPICLADGSNSDSNNSIAAACEDYVLSNGVNNLGLWNYSSCTSGSSSCSNSFNGTGSNGKTATNWGDLFRTYFNNGVQL